MSRAAISESEFATMQANMKRYAGPYGDDDAPARPVLGRTIPAAAPARPTIATCPEEGRGSWRGVDPGQPFGIIEDADPQRGGSLHKSIPFAESFIVAADGTLTLTAWVEWLARVPRQNQFCCAGHAVAAMKGKK